MAGAAVVVVVSASLGHPRRPPLKTRIRFSEIFKYFYDSLPWLVTSEKTTTLGGGGDWSSCGGGGLVIAGTAKEATWEWKQ